MTQNSSTQDSLKQDPLIQLFSINTSSGIPIYRQLVDQIKQAIRIGLLNQEQQLPSVRKVANALQVNPMTVSKAFAQLELEGVLLRKRGIGMLVAETKPQTSIPKAVENALNEFVELSRSSQLNDETMMMLLQQSLSANKERK